MLEEIYMKIGVSSYSFSQLIRNGKATLLEVIESKRNGI